VRRFAHLTALGSATRMGSVNSIVDNIRMSRTTHSILKKLDLKPNRITCKIDPNKPENCGSLVDLSLGWLAGHPSRGSCHDPPQNPLETVVIPHQNSILIPQKFVSYASKIRF
jgi:hypothetical protein